MKIVTRITDGQLQLSKMNTMPKQWSFIKANNFVFEANSLLFIDSVIPLFKEGHWRFRGIKSCIKDILDEYAVHYQDNCQTHLRYSFSIDKWKHNVQLEPYFFADLLTKCNKKITYLEYIQRCVNIYTNNSVFSQ